MRLRLVFISFLNIIATLFGIITILSYVVPDGLPSVAYRIISWAISFILALAFSFWSFHKRVPNRMDAIVRTVSHILIFLMIYGVYGSAFLDRGTSALLSLDFVVQLLLEILAIQLIAYRLRRSKLQSMLGEGRML